MTVRCHRPQRGVKPATVRCHRSETGVTPVTVRCHRSEAGVNLVTVKKPQAWGWCQQSDCYSVRCHRSETGVTPVTVRCHRSETGVTPVTVRCHRSEAGVNLVTVKKPQAWGWCQQSDCYSDRCHRSETGVNQVTVTVLDATGLRQVSPQWLLDATGLRLASTKWLLRCHRSETGVTPVTVRCHRSETGVNLVTVTVLDATGLRLVSTRWLLHAACLKLASIQSWLIHTSDWRTVVKTSEMHWVSLIFIPSSHGAKRCHLVSSHDDLGSLLGVPPGEVRSLAGRSGVLVLLDGCLVQDGRHDLLLQHLNAKLPWKHKILHSPISGNKLEDSRGPVFNEIGHSGSWDRKWGWVMDSSQWVMRSKVRLGYG